MFDLFAEFYVQVFAVTLPSFAIMIFAINGQMAGLTFPQMSRLMLALMVLFGLWYGLSATMAKAGLLAFPATVFDTPYILFFLLGGAAVFWAIGRLSALGRRVIDATDQSFIIGFQIPRMVGGIFLVGWAMGEIPWEFALPAGIGDIWVGYVALQATQAIRRGDADAHQKTMRANIIGLLDMVVAVGTGFATSEGFLHVLSKDAPNIVSDYPLVFFPAFFVPIFLTFHLFSLGKLRQEKALPVVSR